jgi:hypothetical protein
MASLHLLVEPCSAALRSGDIGFASFHRWRDGPRRTWRTWKCCW